MNTMRKKNVLFVCLILASINLMAATRATILLLHNGNATSFDNNQLSDAMAAATHGDTIYLSEGAFDVDTLIVDKVVSIIGAGEMTKVRGDVHIGIDDNPRTNNNMFDAIDIQGDVKVIKELRGLKFKKCKMKMFWASANVTDVYMDRCNIYKFLTVQTIKSAIVVNSYISSLGEYYSSNSSLYPRELGVTSEGNDLNFINCTIYTIVGYSLGEKRVFPRDASFVNCNIRDYSTTDTNANNSFSYTLLGREKKYISSSCSYDNCYFVDPVTYNKITEEEYLAKGYLGNDGTIVGYKGGSTPYNLVPSGYTVSESLLKVDTEKKQLNVTLKLNANQ